MIDWIGIANDIFKLLDIDDDNIPIVDYVSEDSVRFERVDRTMVRFHHEPGTFDKLWLCKNGSTDYLLYTLFHECYHVLQKQNGVKLEYSSEDRKKYVCNKNMLMLYKYDFEAEATGYASAFVYKLYELCHTKEENNLNRIIEDKYDCIEDYPKCEFDSEEDFIAINKKIQKYYTEGKKYLDYMIESSIPDKRKDSFKGLINKKDFLIYLSDKFFNLLNIYNKIKD